MTLPFFRERQWDFLSGITVKDDMDPEPEFKADYKQVDLNAPGTYTVVYTAKDRSGNENKLERKIVVKKNEELDQKIVYLTFETTPVREYREDS